MTIGQRAAQCIKERAWEIGITFRRECDDMGINDSQMRVWASGKMNPSAHFLAVMCSHGYDIKYILTGERKDNG